MKFAGCEWLELLQHAKRINPFTEVIIITGYASLKRRSPMKYDAFDYVVKPLNNVFDIRKKVRRALEKQHLAMENQRLLQDLQERNAELQTALSESKDLQAELIQSEKLAGIGTLAAGVAHEVSSPLFGIMGLAEAIPDEDERENIDKYAQEIVTYCQSIREIVVDLSSYSRNARRHEDEPVNINACIEDAVRLVQRALKMDGISIDMNLNGDGSLYASSTEVTQIFVNLIKNAVEAVRDERHDSGGMVRCIPGKQSTKYGPRCQTMGRIPADVRRKCLTLLHHKPPGKGTGLDSTSRIESSPNIGAQSRSNRQTIAVRHFGCAFRSRRDCETAHQAHVRHRHSRGCAGDSRFWRYPGKP